MDRPLTLDPYILFLLGLGAVVLLVSWAPVGLKRLPLTLAILCVAIGVLIFSTGLLSFNPDPRTWDTATERLTELVVIISLLGAGLKIDRPPGWRAWSTTTRLLVVAMPLTIAAVALLGWAGLGFSLAMALLFGASMAPTDPVLAADVQCGPPGSGDEDEVRFGLTSEAGLNAPWPSRSSIWPSSPPPAVWPPSPDLPTGSPSRSAGNCWPASPQAG